MDIDNYLAGELGAIEKKIKTLSSINKNDEAINLENFMLGIFNIVFSTSFVNMNEKESNYPGIDLYSESKRIGIQVTTNTKPSKKRSCLEQVDKLIKNKDIVIDSLYIFALTTSDNNAALNQTKYFNYNNILNIKYIIGLEEDIKEKICKYIQNYNKRMVDVVYQKNLKLIKDVFVETEIYVKAKEKLKDKHSIILNGNAGTGKTITSYKLLFDYIEEGYLYIKSPNDISKEDIKTNKYILFNDDFIAKTDVSSANYEKIEEDLSALHFAGENFKIILNSRTNIINTYSTKNTRINFNEYRSHFVSTEKLSRIDKFNIIKSHIAYSYDKGTLEQLFRIGQVGYRIYEIIDHKKFNPRIIETFRREEITKSTEFVNKIIDSLDNPDKIYNEQYKLLSDDEQKILKFICIMGGSVSYADLRNEFGYLLKCDLDNYIINLTDSFLIQTEVKNDNFSYTFFNPSIEDFCEDVVKTMGNIDSLLKDNIDKRAILKLLGYQNISLEKKIKLISEHDQKLDILRSAQHHNKDLYNYFKEELSHEFIRLANIPYDYGIVLPKEEIKSIESKFSLGKIDYISYGNISSKFSELLKEDSISLNTTAVRDKIVQDYEYELSDYLIEQVNNLDLDEESTEEVEDVISISMIKECEKEFEGIISCSLAESVLNVSDFDWEYKENDSSFKYLREFLNKKNVSNNFSELIDFMSSYDFDNRMHDVEEYVRDNIISPETSSDTLKELIEEFKMEVETIK